MASPTNQFIARLNTFYYPPEGTQICYSWETPLFAFPFPINLLHLMMDLSLDFYIRARVVSCPFFCLAWRQFKEHRRMKNAHLSTWCLFASSTVAFPLALTMLLTPTQNTAANVVFQTCSFLTRYIFIFLIWDNMRPSSISHSFQTLPQNHYFTTTSTRALASVLSPLYQPELPRWTPLLSASGTTKHSRVHGLWVAAWVL